MQQAVLNTGCMPPEGEVVEAPNRERLWGCTKGQAGYRTSLSSTAAALQTQHGPGMASRDDTSTGGQAGIWCFCPASFTPTRPHDPHSSTGSLLGHGQEGRG